MDVRGYFGGLRGRRRLLLWGGAALAAVTALFYCLFTQQVWEDYFITFKFSQNLAAGKGLVYYEGERVHGFTSPLGVLLPALCQWVTGGADLRARPLAIPAAVLRPGLRPGRRPADADGAGGRASQPLARRVVGGALRVRAEIGGLFGQRQWRPR